MAVWWLERPSILEEELASLRDSGIAFQIDKDAQDLGILAIDASVDVGGKATAIRIVYPDLYPYFRFEVYAPELSLERHQHPFSKNLCLIGRATENWDLDSTVGEFLTTQLPRVLDAAAQPAGTSAIEERQGEPYSDYYFTQQDAILFIDSKWTVPESATKGSLRIRLGESASRSITLRASGLDAPVIRGVVAEAFDSDGNTLFAADQALLDSLDPGTDVRGRWIRVDRPPEQTRPPSPLAAFEKLVDAAWPGSPQRERYGDRFRLDITGVVFREEVRYGEWADAWVFFVRAYRGRNPSGVAYIVGAARAGNADLFERVPELRPLAQRTAAIFGLGGIGAPVALELARAGIGSLSLLDHDRVEAGTAVRWPLGLESAGRLKVDAIGDWIKRNLPYTSVHTYAHHLGSVRANLAGRSDVELLSEMLTGADIVVDATAEVGIHYPLALAAREREIPYIEASTRAGGWGGVIARVSPDADRACWLCYQYQLADWRNGGGPIPAADPSGLHQPLGCADPTFTGAGFDVAEYGLTAVRLAVGTMLEGGTSMYPDPDWDIAILNLRDHAGGIDVPTWHTTRLELHAHCPNHATQRVAVNV